MKRILFVILMLTGSIVARSQDTLWLNDLAKATEIAQKENKKVMLFFTGSDWCGWCVRLQNEVFKKEEFINWAKEHVVLVELDFPRNKQLEPNIAAQNNQLQQMFGIRGYPTVWFVNSSITDGKINLEKLGSTGYVAGGPTAWLQGAESIIHPVKTE